jgi:hypothetical protein
VKLKTVGNVKANQVAKVAIMDIVKTLKAFAIR